MGSQDMTKEEFQEQAFRTIASAGVAYLLEGPSPKGPVPVGIALGQLVRHRIEPSFHWFSWARPRQKIECAVHFINEVRRSQLVVVPAPRADWPFWERICRHGIMKRIGKSEDFIGWGEDGMIFQSLRPPMI